MEPLENEGVSFLKKIEMHSWKDQMTAVAVVTFKDETLRWFMILIN